MARIRRPEAAATVYSTDGGRVTDRPARQERGTPQQRPGAPPRDGVVRVSRTSSGRGGKTVTLVTGLPTGDLTRVAAELKRLCGSGGTVKDGVVEIQGDHRQKIVARLASDYTTKLAGG